MSLAVLLERGLAQCLERGLAQRLERGLAQLLALPSEVLSDWVIAWYSQDFPVRGIG